jgi:hypothetical protein
LYEDPNLGQAALRALQNHPPKRRGDDHLHQSKTQTEAGLKVSEIRSQSSDGERHDVRGTAGRLMSHRLISEV